MIVFENLRYGLSAILNCNGIEQNYNGVSICQSREYLLQSISFPEDVKVSKGVSGPAERDSECPVLKRVSKRLFEFKIPNRECRYAFVGESSKKIHTLYTIGYENIIVRD